MRWKLADVDATLVGTMSENLEVQPLIARLLLLRGLDNPDEARKFLQPSLRDLPDPSQFADIEIASNRLADAITRSERIAIYGDYDVDGVTSSALLATFLRGFDLDPGVFIPDRFTDGYGLNAGRVSELVEDGAQVLITVDCGTSNRKEVAIAQDSGCDVIVVDHHAVPEFPAEPLALLNPVRSDCNFPFPRLAAVGVAFFLCVAVRRTLRERGFFSPEKGEPDLRALLPLVALGTVADVMPLTSVNRLLVTQGLMRMNMSPSPGFAALAQVSGIDERPITSTDLGFKLGPRINAAGRMTHARGGFELLTTTNWSQASELAHQLNQENQSRRDVEANVVREALEEAEGLVASGAKGLVLFRPNWHLGVVGIVAARVREAFHRPVFILGEHPQDGMAKGSGRSIPGFDLVKALDQCSETLLQYGGHAHAAGVTVEPDRLQSFATAFNSVVDAQLSDEDFDPTLKIDGLINAEKVDLYLFESIEKLAPFGAGNPRPVFGIKGTQAARFRTIGDGSHVEMHVPQGSTNVRAIGFRMGKEVPLLESQVDIAFQLKENLWRGNRSLELNLKDIRAAEI